MDAEQAPKMHRIDVRQIPLAERHARIFAAFDALDEGSSMIVVTDHEPRPLRFQFDQRYGGRIVWSQRHFGIGRWEATLWRVPASSEALADSPIGLISRCSVFADVRAETRQRCAAVASERLARDGDTLVEQDTQWPYLGLVRSGSLAALMGSKTGREQRLFDVFPGETFGDIETLDGGRTVARLVATSATAIVLIPRGVAISAMNDDAAFALAIAVVGAQRARALAEAYSDQVAQPAIVRVIHAILPYATPDAGLAPSLAPLRRMTQAQLAETAGTAREVAARAVAQLEARGAIKRAKGHIALVDREKLQMILDEF